MLTTQTPADGRVHAGAMPDPEVPERPVRRRFTAAYKLAILREVDAATEGGQIGAILRRERLYSSHLVDWRRARDRGALEALARPTGRPRPNPLAREVERLRRENARLAARLVDRGTDHRDPGKSLRAPGHPAGPGERGRAERVLMESGPGGGARDRHGPRLPGPGRQPGHRLPPPDTPAEGRATSPARARHGAHRGGARRGPRAAPRRALRDRSPAHVYATLLDEGTYLASERTMYRILAAQGETGERRAQLRHPAYARPELLATGPNQLWSWDITKLRGPATWTWYHLYVLLDVFSRYVVGWLLAHRESGTLADRLIAETVEQGGRHVGAHHPRRPGPLDDQQAGRLPARGPGHHEEPQPTARPRRQPLQRGPVQDHQVPPGLPGPVRLHRGWPRLLPDVLRLVQRRAPPQRAGPDDPRDGPPGPRTRGPGQRAIVLDAAYAAHPERFVRKRPEPPPLPDRGLDQPAQGDAIESVKG